MIEPASSDGIRYHSSHLTDLLSSLSSDPERGLDDARVAAQRERFGLNQLAEAPRTPAWRKLLSQFEDLVIWILFFAAIVSGALGEWVDAIAILAIVLLNGVIGFFQEERAEQALAALQRLSAPMRTELGHIAGMLQRHESEPTPLQHRLAELGRILIVMCLVIVGVIFALQVMRQGHLAEAFLVSVSLAVAAVPEGLPAVVTIALALGLQRMVKRNALVRKLPSVETLGSVTVIELGKLTIGKYWSR